MPGPDSTGTGAAADGPPAPLQLRALIFGHVVSQIVGTVARLRIADQLGATPRSGDELARATGAHPDALARLLRAGVSVGLFREAGDRYALTSLGELLRSDTAGLRDLAEALTAPAHWRSIEHMCQAVVTGTPAPPQVLGTSLWDYYEHHPEERAAFAAAMGSISASVAEEVVGRVDLSRFRRVVDVAGSHGVLLTRVLEANPEATGVLFDLPGVIEEARDAVGATGVADRVELVAGDVFAGVPPGGDLYLLKHILHDWDDDRAARILESCHRAGTPGTTLLVVERLLGPGADPVAHVADMLMMVMFGGRERTEAEYRSLLEGAGFRLDRVVTLTMFAVMEAVRV